jgi:hypothetical protein
MITCETTDRMWTVEGKIEDLAGTYGGDGAHVGIDDLSDLLAKHVGKWAKVRVELTDGPPPRSNDEVDAELERMRSLAKRVRELLAMLRAMHSVQASEGMRFGFTPEETVLELTAETMLVVCDRLEDFFRRLRKLEAGGAP